MNRTAKCSHNEHYAAILEQLLLPAATWVRLKNIYLFKLAKLIYRGKKKSEVREVEAEISQERDSCRGDGDALYDHRSWDTENTAVMTCAFHDTSVLPQRKKKNHKQTLDSGCRCCYCCSVAQSCLTLGDPVECSTPGLPVSHHLPKFAQVHVRCTGDAIQPSHSLKPSFLSALNLSDGRQGL